MGWVPVQGGTFTMGDTSGGGRSDETLLYREVVSTSAGPWQAGGQRGGPEPHGGVQRLALFHLVKVRGRICPHSSRGQLPPERALRA
jgi:hypothetical protein